MKLNLNFDALTFLSGWWSVVKENFETVQNAFNQEEKDRKQGNIDLNTAISDEATARINSDVDIAGSVSVLASQLKTETTGRINGDQNIIKVIKQLQEDLNGAENPTFETQYVEIDGEYVGSNRPLPYPLYYGYVWKIKNAGNVIAEVVIQHIKDIGNAIDIGSFDNSGVLNSNPTVIFSAYPEGTIFTAVACEEISDQRYDLMWNDVVYNFNAPIWGYSAGERIYFKVTQLYSKTIDETTEGELTIVSHGTPDYKAALWYRIPPSEWASVNMPSGERAVFDFGKVEVDMSEEFAVQEFSYDKNIYGCMNEGDKFTFTVNELTGTGYVETDNITQFALWVPFGTGYLYVTNISPYVLDHTYTAVITKVGGTDDDYEAMVIEDNHITTVPRQWRALKSDVDALKANIGTMSDLLDSVNGA